MNSKKFLIKNQDSDIGNIKYLKEIGFSVDEHGKAEFNPNIFADYFLEQVKLVVFQDNFFYLYQKGMWQPFSDHQLMRTVRYFINKAKPNLYSRYMGQNALEILRLAAPEVKEMDVFKNHINMSNGMLDLETYRLIEHSSDFFSTVQVPIIYDPTAVCSKFETFIHEIFEGDFERISVLQEIIGYILTAETKIHKAFFFHGDGANGKSVLLELITRLIGRENVSNLSLKDLEKSFNRAILMGKTVNIATENEVSGKGFNSQYLKAIVSGDSITVEKKYQDAISYSPICKLVFATNNLPSSNDCSYGFYRRICIIPFNVRFTEETADLNLKHKLESELPGILNWALAGLKRLRHQQYNFSKSSIVDNAFLKYKAEHNPMSDYITEMLKTAPGNRLRKADIVNQFYIWRKKNGLSDGTVMSAQKFWAMFKISFTNGGFIYTEQTSSGVRYIKDVAFQNIVNLSTG